MKGLILLANHFEDVEALITVDMLRRANITIDLVSITGSYELVTQANVKIKAEYLIEDINLNDYQFLVIPGGKAVFETHLNSEVTKKCVEHFMKKKALIATICAAPSILGKMGLLKNQKFVCFPGCEENIVDGILASGKKVVTTNNLITSKAAGTTFDFAHAIISYLTTREKADSVIHSVYYNL